MQESVEEETNSMPVIRNRYTMVSMMLHTPSITPKNNVAWYLGNRDRWKNLRSKHLQKSDLQQD